MLAPVVADRVPVSGQQRRLPGVCRRQLSALRDLPQQPTCMLAPNIYESLFFASMLIELEKVLHKQNRKFICSEYFVFQCVFLSIQLFHPGWAHI